MHVEITNSSNNKKLVLRKVRSFRIEKVKDNLLRIGVPTQTSQNAEISDLDVAYEDIVVDFTVQGGDDVDGLTNFTDIPAIINYIFNDFFTSQNMSVRYTLRLLGGTSFSRDGSLASVSIDFSAQAQLANGTLRFMVGTVL